MRFRKQRIRWRELALISAACGSAIFSFASAAEAKTPGKTYCFRGYCHRVLTIAETVKITGQTIKVVASNYDDCKRDRFNPCGLTSSGAVFRADVADNAASPIYPDGTVVLVRHPGNGKTAVLRINSAGPYHKNRTLDVSRATAKVLGFQRAGVASLEVRVLKAPTKSEAAYRKNRVYPAVAGYVGNTPSIELASAVFGPVASPVTVAAIYPQLPASRAGGAIPNSALLHEPALDNGIERTWLARSITFAPTAREAKLHAKARQQAQRQAQLVR